MNNILDIDSINATKASNNINFHINKEICPDKIIVTLSIIKYRGDYKNVF